MAGQLLISRLIAFFLSTTILIGWSIPAEAARVLILGVLREFSEKLFMLLFAWGKTAVSAVLPRKELTHILHEVLCAKGFKVNTLAQRAGLTEDKWTWNNLVAYPTLL